MSFHILIILFSMTQPQNQQVKGNITSLISSVLLLALVSYEYNAEPEEVSSCQDSIKPSYPTVPNLSNPTRPKKRGISLSFLNSPVPFNLPICYSTVFPGINDGN